MLVIRESDTKEGIWREYMPGVRVKIRAIDKPLLRTMRLAATRRVEERDPRTGRKTIGERVDDTLFDHLVYRHAIEAWEGVVGPDREALPCTDDMKDLATDKASAFANWVLEEATTIGELDTQALEAETKN